MELIPHSQFGKLRLRQFDPKATDHQETRIEFLDSRWFGESLEAIKFLRRVDDHSRLGCIRIMMDWVESELLSCLLSALKLPLLFHQMPLKEVVFILGEPTGTLREKKNAFVAHEFICGTTDRYYIRCWFYGDGGLDGFDLVRGDLLPNGFASEPECPGR